MTYRDNRGHDEAIFQEMGAKHGEVQKDLKQKKKTVTNPKTGREYLVRIRISSQKTATFLFAAGMPSTGSSMRGRGGLRRGVFSEAMG